MTDIGNKIAQLRRRQGWSQSELARRIEASREAIGKYERGEASPSVETAKKIADAFQVTLDFLVGDSPQASFDKKTLQRLLDIQQMEPQAREQILSIIDAVIRDYKARQAYAS